MKEIMTNSIEERNKKEKRMNFTHQEQQIVIYEVGLFFFLFLVGKLAGRQLQVEAEGDAEIKEDHFILGRYSPFPSFY